METANKREELYFMIVHNRNVLILYICQREVKIIKISVCHADFNERYQGVHEYEKI